ncbi:MAG: 16S rRNA (adenine(1518)-N(6)/adenine(1519)-N(6))-dimethyltransferase [Holosporales bacterium]|jgi:16S rRNA (adenine1518-N6/adenine1519-N6)-dimethyltransferase|nr:16S rRNA (adenine(1518)-N(6)/adenine(1519)-N(6))-dimethyltransferase [Holosporales bacterium]
MLDDAKLTVQIVKNTAALQSRVRAKRFGQHFLVNPRILERIVDAAEPLQGKTIVEIGPGPGGLTREILRRRPAQVFVIEKDPRFVESLVALDGVTVFNEDACDFDYNQLINDNRKISETTDDFSLSQSDQPAPANIRKQIFAAIEVMNVVDINNRLLPDISALVHQFYPHCQGTERRRIKIISNLPYNAGTAIYVNALKHADIIEDMTLMFQKEVAARLLGKPNTRDYGRLSVLTQYFTEARRVMRLTPGAFYPPPKVYSDVLHFKNRTDADPRVLDDLSAVCLEIFQHRRKKLKNRLIKNTREN